MLDWVENWLTFPLGSHQTSREYSTVVTRAPELDMQYEPRRRAQHGLRGGRCSRGGGAGLWPIRRNDNRTSAGTGGAEARGYGFHLALLRDGSGNK